MFCNLAHKVLFIWTVFFKFRGKIPIIDVTSFTYANINVVVYFAHSL